MKVQIFPSINNYFFKLKLVFKVFINCLKINIGFALIELFKFNKILYSEGRYNLLFNQTPVKWILFILDKVLKISLLKINSVLESFVVINKTLFANKLFKELYSGLDNKAKAVFFLF